MRQFASPRKQRYLSKCMAEARSDIEVLARSRLPAILSDALGLGANQVRVTPAKSGAYDFAADARGYTSPGDPDAVADEQVAVTARNVVEVDVAIERSTHGSHDGQLRVPSSS